MFSPLARCHLICKSRRSVFTTVLKALKNYFSCINPSSSRQNWIFHDISRAMLASLTRQIPAAGPNNQRWRSAVCRASPKALGGKSWTVSHQNVSSFKSSKFDPWQIWVPTHLQPSRLLYVWFRFLHFQQTSAKMSLSETRISQSVLTIHNQNGHNLGSSSPFGIQTPAHHHLGWRHPKCWCLWIHPDFDGSDLSSQIS